MKARLKKELGQTGGLVSVFGELFVAQERHRGLVGSGQAWMQGMPELSSEIWQLGLLVHCGLLAPDSLAAGQKSPIQLILQQILKNSFNGLGREGGSAADLPSVSRSRHATAALRGPFPLVSHGWLRAAKRCSGVPGHGCSSGCCQERIRRSPKTVPASRMQQLAAELAPAAAWLSVGTWGFEGRPERDMKDGEQSRPSPGKERPATCSGGLPEPLRR